MLKLTRSTLGQADRISDHNLQFVNRTQYQKNGPAQLEPKWQDQFWITTILSKLIAVTEAVDQEFCVTPFILPPHLNLP